MSWIHAYMRLLWRIEKSKSRQRVYLSKKITRNLGKVYISNVTLYSKPAIPAEH